MKKTILLLLLFVICFGCTEQPSCTEQPNYIQGHSQKSGVKEINYFKDSRTGLCFAERGSSDSYAFTCVPCDSIKNFLENIPTK